MNAALCRRGAAITVALAVLIHLAAVWSVPWLVTGLFMRRAVAQAGVNRMATPPLPDDTSRGVVAPSPDQLYAACLFDIGNGRVRITAHRATDYWSLALYDTNADNFFHIGTADAGRDEVELILGREPTAGALPEGAIYVHTPHDTGVLLARFLVLDRAHPDAAETARASVHCKPVEG